MIRWENNVKFICYNSFDIYSCYYPILKPVLPQKKTYPQTSKGMPSASTKHSIADNFVKYIYIQKKITWKNKKEGVLFDCSPCYGFKYLPTR